MKLVFRYFFNICYALVRGGDIVLNALCAGDPRETISSRMGKALSNSGDCKVCTLICDLMNKIDPRHCETSIDPDVGDLAVDQ